MPPFHDVIQYITWGAWAFMSLWLLATLFKEGMWGNYLTYVCWWLSLIVMLNLGYGLTGFVLRQMGSNGEDPLIATLAGVGICGITMVVSLAILRTMTDKLSRVKITFPPALNAIGSVLLMLSLMTCGTLTVMHSVGMMVSSPTTTPWWLQPGRWY